MMITPQLVVWSCGGAPRLFILLAHSWLLALGRFTNHKNPQINPLYMLYYIRNFFFMLNIASSAFFDSTPNLTTLGPFASSLIGKRDCTIKAIFPSEQAMAVQHLCANSICQQPRRNAAESSTYLHFSCVPADSTAHIAVRFCENFQCSPPWMTLLQISPQRCASRSRNPSTGRVNIPPATTLATNNAPRTSTGTQCRKQRRGKLNDT
jgi:hypothetical protein